MPICVIPARAGSKRIPGKNWKVFHGKPIIQYSIEAAEKSGLFDEIYVSTDSREVKRIAGVLGCTIIDRPIHLGLNEVGTQDIVKSVLEQIVRNSDPANDYVCCLYATSPLLSVEDLKRGLLLLKSNRQMEYAFSVGNNPLHDAGNYYWGHAKSFLNSIPIHREYSIMVPIDESRVCDINTNEDWTKAEKMYTKLHGIRL